MTTKPPKAAPAARPDPVVAKQSWDNNQMALGVVVALIVILLTIVYLLSRGKKKGRSILIVGPSDAGKTSVFVQLWQKISVDTVTSVVSNDGEYIPSNGRPALILKDLPGNERLRQKFWESNKAGVRGIICLLDAAGGSKAIRDGAEVLYAILTDSLVSKVRPNVLIFANKQDLPTAKGIRVIRTALEREITTLRLTKSASLQTTEGNTQLAKVLGRPDKDFDFDQLLPLKVEFAEGTGNTNSGSLKPIFDWLDRTA